MKNKTFVVTGGAGFIGSHLVNYLASKGNQVKIIDKSSNTKLMKIKNKDNIEIHKIDILEKEKLKKILENTDGVFHQAALVSVIESEVEPEKYHKVNVIGTENIFSLAKELNLKVVFASSSSVYGNMEKMPIQENFKLESPNVYGRTKIKCEKLAQKYTKEGVKIIGLRYFNVYGEGQSNTRGGVITNFLNQIKNEKPLIIQGNGFQTRDFIYVLDVVKANFKAMTKKIDHGFFNIGSGKSISINNLAKMMLNISDSKLEIKHVKNKDSEIKHSLADIDLAQKELGWKYNTELKKWFESKLK